MTRHSASTSCTRSSRAVMGAPRIELEVSRRRTQGSCGSGSSANSTAYSSSIVSGIRCSPRCFTPYFRIELFSICCFLTSYSFRSILPVRYSSSNCCIWRCALYSYPAAPAAAPPKAPSPAIPRLLLTSENNTRITTNKVHMIHLTYKHSRT